MYSLVSNEVIFLQSAEEQARSLFHGNTRNRWFDKGTTISVAASAVVGISVEHSGIDATVSGRDCRWSFMLVY